MKNKLDQIISLAKRRGLIYQASEIYGGLANTWDYGPLGVELKNNIKQSWWQWFVRRRQDVVGLDSSILMNQEVWQASGHVGGFSDPLIDCRNCKNRFRADKLLEDYFHKKDLEPEEVEGLSPEQLSNKITEYKPACPHCGKSDFTSVRQFNLMFKTHQGVSEDSQNLVYLRPETAQGIFVNFKNIYTTSRQKIPFGVAQIGKAFRNEISPGNFIFRTREFEQMELEYFCREDQVQHYFEHWQDYCRQWLDEIGIDSELIRMRKHSSEELSHYSQATTDIEFNFPFGWGELWGVAHRGKYDLTQHQNKSGKELSYFDPQKNEKFLPDVIEPSLGVDRLMLALILSAYEEDEIDGEKRALLKFKPKLAPIQVGILPLTKKQAEKASQMYQQLGNHFSVDYDVSGSIGRRYRRFDEIGVPFCVTVDFDSETDDSVTVRDRDSTNQDRVKITELVQHLANKIGYGR